MLQRLPFNVVMEHSKNFIGRPNASNSCISYCKIHCPVRAAPAPSSAWARVMLPAHGIRYGKRHRIEEGQAAQFVAPASEERAPVFPFKIHTPTKLVKSSRLQIVLIITTTRISCNNITNFPIITNTAKNIIVVLGCWRHHVSTLLLF